MIKKLWQDKEFRIFAFTVVNALISFGATELMGIEGEFQVYAVGLAIPFLNALSKYVNTNWFGDIGVNNKK